MNIVNYNCVLQQTQSYGLKINFIISNGSIIRCPFIGDKPSKKSGWYIAWNVYISGSYMLIGFYGSWKNGLERHSFKGDKDQFSQNKFEQYKKQVKKLLEREKVKQKIKYKKASIRAQSIFYKLTNNGYSEYCKNKKIKPIGNVKFYLGTLVIPVFKDDTIVSIQAITKTGFKKFLPGSKTAGGYFPIEGKGKVALVEGYATGVTIHLATGWNIIVCFNTTGLVRVAPQLIGKDVVICSDNDFGTEARTGKNPGIEASNKAARILKCKVLYPKESEIDLSITDWNDVYCAKGIDYVRRKLLAK